MNKQPEPSNRRKLSIKYLLTQKEASIQHILEHAIAKGGETQKAAIWWGSLKPEEKRLVCDATPSTAIQCLLTAETRPFAAFCDGLWVAFYPPVTRVFSPCAWVYELLPLGTQEHVSIELKRGLPIPQADQTRYSVEILHNLKSTPLSSKKVTTTIKKKMAVTLGLNGPVHTLSAQYTSKFHDLLVCVWQEHISKQQTTHEVNPSCGRKGIDHTVPLREPPCESTRVSADITRLAKTDEVSRGHKRSKTCQDATLGAAKSKPSSAPPKVNPPFGSSSTSTETSEFTFTTREQAVDKSGQLTLALQSSITLPKDTTVLSQQPPSTPNHTEIHRSSVVTDQYATKQTVSPPVSIQTTRSTTNKPRVQVPECVPANQMPRAQINDSVTTVPPPMIELNITADQDFNTSLLPTSRASVIVQQSTHPNKLALFEEGDVQAFEIQLQRKFAQLEHAVQLLEPQHCSE
jgi:hypothetical protein